MNSRFDAKSAESCTPVLGLCLGLLTGCLALLKQENLETPWAAERRASVLGPPQSMLGNMPADSTTLWVGH